MCMECLRTLCRECVEIESVGTLCRECVEIESVGTLCRRCVGSVCMKFQGGV